MNKIEQMVKEMCPGGVKMTTIGEACEILDYLRKPISKANRIAGKYPYYGANGIQDWVSGYILDGTYILLGEDGSVINPDKSPIMHFVSGKIWVNNHAHILKEINNQVNLKYVFYALQLTDVSDIVRGVPPKINQANLRTITIPLPPLPIQEAIVEILDKFESLQQGLQDELQARKKQYEYYRNKLLTQFPDNVQVKEYTLGELGTIKRGNGLQKSDFVESGVGCIHYGQIYTRLNSFTNTTLTFVTPAMASKLVKVEPGNLVIATTSENLEDVCKSVAWTGTEAIVTGAHACVYRHSQNPKYMAYFFQSENFHMQKRKYAYGAKVIDIKPESIAKITINLPSLEYQAQVASFLDHFETLVNDQEKGIPAEIAAVKKQYEYYRNKLLTF